jgi:hypothetical protein
MRAWFSGTYVKVREPWFEVGGLNELDLSRLYSITGKHYKTLLFCTADIGPGENLDTFDVKVFLGGVAGLYTCYESIVMVGARGELWCAFLHDEKVRYFTNIPEWESRLPKTIEHWRSRFSSVDVVMCEPSETVPSNEPESLDAPVTGEE